MKAKRRSGNRKTMQVYTTSFNFRDPYQVLVDSNVCLSAVAQNLDIHERLQDVLCAPCRPVITQCCVEHLYKLGSEGQKAVEMARLFERKKCNHWVAKTTTAECLKGVIGESNKMRYCVMTQSPDLRSSLRQIPGLPIIYTNSHSVTILEAPSEATVAARKQVELQKLQAPSAEMPSLPSNSVIEGHETATAGRLAGNNGNSERRTAEAKMKKRKSRKGSGPNPLSVRKRKPKKEQVLTSSKSKQAGASMADKKEVKKKARWRAQKGQKGQDGASAPVSS